MIHDVNSLLLQARKKGLLVFERMIGFRTARRDSATSAAELNLERLAQTGGARAPFAAPDNRNFGTLAPEAA